MRRLAFDGGSVRAQRLRALAPRVLVLATIAILALGGLRNVLSGPPAPVVRAAPAATDQRDLGVEALAESFARVYLTWDADHPDEREIALARFVGDSADPRAGLRPAEGARQTVAWTAVAAVERAPGRALVTVAAQTDRGLLHLAVPVARTAGGALRIAGYPALVGPPAIDGEDALEPAGNEARVDDEALTEVVTRALGNYLARAQTNLLADLTGDALVSLPDRALRLTSTERPTWAIPNRRIAIEVEAIDAGGTELTLRYELEVRLSDRWYVRAIHVDPTS